MKPLRSRRIPAYPKSTGADTQYWDLDPDDEAYLYQWLYRLLADMSETATYEPEIQKEWFKRKPGLFPKGKSGPNSYASILGGICSAKLQNPGKNLSTPQLDVVEHLFDIVAHHYGNEPGGPEAVIFDKKIFSLE
jgi:hypothetical protein